MTRTRTEYSNALTGTLEYGEPYWGIPITSTPKSCSNKSEITDSLGRQFDHPMELNKYIWSIQGLNGTDNQMPFKYVKFTDCPPDIYGITAPGLMDMSSHLPPDSATKLIALTNPSRPILQIPQMVGELRDVPKLLKSAGRTLIRGGANAFLSYQYGWKPLIKDLISVFDMGTAIDRRIDELNRLYSGSGLKRRVTLARGEASGIVSTNEWVQSSPVIVSTLHTIKCEVKQWGTIRWRPAPGDHPPRTKAEEHRLTRTLLGLNPGQWGQSAWELLPWSWLSDWCGNVGDWLTASNNELGAQFSNINIMTKTVATHQWSPDYYSRPGISGGGATCIRTQLLRTVGGNPTLAARLPFLSGTQLAVLGSLAIQRVPRHLLK